MTYIRGACQQCGGHIEFPTSAVGQSTACPHCGCETVLTASPQLQPAIGGGSVARRRMWIACSAAAVLVIASGAAIYFLGIKREPVTVPTTAVPAISSVHPRPSAPVKPVPAPDPWHGLMAGPVQLEKSGVGKLVYAVGTISNATDHQRFGVKVQLDVFDKSGDKLDPATDYTEVIEPGKNWRFRALIIDRNAARAQLHSLSEEK